MTTSTSTPKDSHYFAQKLSNYHSKPNNSPFLILSTSTPLTTSQTPSTPPSYPVSHLYTLDSSFNPPTRAHAALASHFLRKAAALHTRRNFADPKPTYRLVLLLSVQNADKKPAPLPYEQRLSLMQRFAEDLLARFERDASANHITQFVEVDVAVTRDPLYFRKARNLLEFEGFAWGEGPGCTHVVGSDTLVRILNPKYYRDLCAGDGDLPLDVLGEFFSDNDLCVVMRPSSKKNEDTATSDEPTTTDDDDEGMEMREALHKGDLEAEGGQRRWADKIEMIRQQPGDEDIGTISSTRIRSAAESGDWGTVEELCTPGVAGDIKMGGLYGV